MCIFRKSYNRKSSGFSSFTVQFYDFSKKGTSLLQECGFKDELHDFSRDSDLDSQRWSLVW